ncbi:helix-turn-helix domain-containing protein [Vampirovibrio chlorellavorus]|uniref:helix-turn-helix domain-containing protein n=1 Tax=Vampirovibrio chlorellavorus TaxID=758823 RepID=UPI0026F33D3F|nr:helix-turn-helix domain-containing protein [Vampirovibrio chlorellavorus]
MNTPNLLSIKQLASELTVSEQTIRQWIKLGLVQAIKLRKKWVVPLSQLESIKKNGIPH